VFELMEMSDAIAELILRKAGAAELRHAAMREGMVPIDDDARRKVAAGVTTASEAGLETPTPPA
jgi:type II secretory ATPase GspE/PulE/Tfp pilus assembly ATPase PilB-like protein